jgi:hypothetical protein
MSAQMTTFPCPKCNQPCEKCGEILEDRARLDVFQCDNSECNVDWLMEGVAFPIAYTFVVGADGIARDPSNPLDPMAN